MSKKIYLKSFFKEMCEDEKKLRRLSFFESLRSAVDKFKVAEYRRIF